MAAGREIGERDGAAGVGGARAAQLGDRDGGAGKRHPGLIGDHDVEGFGRRDRGRLLSRKGEGRRGHRRADGETGEGTSEHVECLGYEDAIRYRGPELR